jgi:hypothetical protein
MIQRMRQVHEHRVLPRFEYRQPVPGIHEELRVEGQGREGALFFPMSLRR